MLGIGRPIFDKSVKIALGTPRHPQGPQGLPKGPPRYPRGTSAEAPRDPMGLPRGPRAPQREPSGPQIQAKGTPKPGHGQPKQAKRTDYINKLPINRLRGRYVKINKRNILKKYGPYGPQGPWAQPLFDCVAVPSRGFFSAKTASQTNIIRIY